MSSCRRRFVAFGTSRRLAMLVSSLTLSALSADSPIGDSAGVDDEGSRAVS